MSSGNLSSFSPIISSKANKPRLVVIVGPTAVGKTEISIQVAERVGGEIVSADSRQFYRAMDIGTAKPPFEARDRVPHHLIDVSDPRQIWSLPLYQKAAQSAISQIISRGHLPLLVGGTGQYIHAVTDGWTPPVAAPNPAIRKELEDLAKANGNAWLYDLLQKKDPSAALKIDHRNLRRVVRALEVIQLTGKKFSEQGGKIEGPYNLLTIGLTLPRTELYARVDARVELMFASGFLEEVQHLLDAGISPDLPAMTSIGYRECVMVVERNLSIDEAKAQMRRRTRVLIRRQANWFKLTDPSIRWIEAGLSPAEEIISIVREFLLT